MIADTNNKTDLLIIALNTKTVDGSIERANALNIPVFLKQMIQIRQYRMTNNTSTIRYNANASSDHQPNQVPGILIIINPKQPNLPICSTSSIHLLFHLFSKPSLYFIANTILGIIIMTINISPHILNHSIIPPTTSDIFYYQAADFSTPPLNSIVLPARPWSI